MSGSLIHPPAEVDLEVLEVPIRLSFTAASSRLVDRVLEGWADCGARLADGGHEPADRILVLGPGEAPSGDLPHLTAADERVFLTNLASRLTVTAIDRRAGELMMLHGCAVADPATGRVAAFAAPSGTGKTTFSLTLAGDWAYVTDETVAIRPDGTVVPYPKPLSVIEPALAAGTKTQTPAGSVGIPVAGPDGLRLVALGLLDRQPGHQGVTVEEIGTVDALALLAPETSYLARHDEPLQLLARLVIEAGGLRRLVYAEAADLAPVVAEMLEVSA